jgi:nitrite reductase/ring-hydroxylating ferredoxin subunit
MMFLLSSISKMMSKMMPVVIQQQHVAVVVVVVWMTLFLCMEDCCHGFLLSSSSSSSSLSLSLPLQPLTRQANNVDYYNNYKYYNYNLKRTRQHDYASIFSTKSSTTGTTTAETSSPTTTSADNVFANFDYEACWYPVIWIRDLRMKEPTKVTLFDVDYVVAKISDTEVIALNDRCPHKAAALSEGRITETNRFQCAYHGWTFDGTTGDCTEIPQIAQADPNNNSKVNIPTRSCAKAVPVQIHQEMVYLFVGGTAEDALLAPPPPSVPEYDDPTFRLSCSIRDMPVDWPIVISNICDADHGMFAHGGKDQQC